MPPVMIAKQTVCPLSRIAIASCKMRISWPPHPLDASRCKILMKGNNIWVLPLTQDTGNMYRIFLKIWPYFQNTAKKSCNLAVFSEYGQKIVQFGRIPDILTIE